MTITVSPSANNTSSSVKARRSREWCGLIISNSPSSNWNCWTNSNSNCCWSWWRLFCALCLRRFGLLQPRIDHPAVERALNGMLGRRQIARDGHAQLNQAGLTGALRIDAVQPPWVILPGGARHGAGGHRAGNDLRDDAVAHHFSASQIARSCAFRKPSRHNSPSMAMAPANRARAKMTSNKVNPCGRFGFRPVRLVCCT